MKLTDADRLYLYGRLLPVIAAVKPTKTPPNKDGQSRPSETAFATACWAKRYVDALEYVLAKDAEPNGRGGSAPVQSGPTFDNSTPF